MRTYINVCLLPPQHPLQLAVILFPPVLATVVAFDFVIIWGILPSCVGAIDFEKLISSLTCLGLRDKSAQPLSLSSWTPSSPAIVDQATKATGQLMRLTFSSAAAMACLSGWNSLACK